MLSKFSSHHLPTELHLSRNTISKWLLAFNRETARTQAPPSTTLQDHWHISRLKMQWCTIISLYSRCSITTHIIFKQTQMQFLALEDRIKAQEWLLTISLASNTPREQAASPSIKLIMISGFKTFQCRIKRTIPRQAITAVSRLPQLCINNTKRLVHMSHQKWITILSRHNKEKAIRNRWGVCNSSNSSYLRQLLLLHQVLSTLTWSKPQGTMHILVSPSIINFKQTKRPYQFSWMPNMGIFPKTRKANCLISIIRALISIPIWSLIMMLRIITHRNSTSCHRKVSCIHHLSQSKFKWITLCQWNKHRITFKFNHCLRRVINITNRVHLYPMLPRTCI